VLVFDRYVDRVGPVELIAFEAVLGVEVPTELLNEDTMPVVGDSSEKAIRKSG
jgi:hypothetical protein